MPSTFRFLRQYLLDPRQVIREETTYRRDDHTLPASLYRPPHSRPLPGWVALHGLTWRGRDHESLDGFARALAASGAVVLVPDHPEWRSLRLAPTATTATIRGAVAALKERRDTTSVTVLGFSFGATQALMASVEVSGIGALASWGGYADLSRTVRFAFTGRHELDGRRYRQDPDPYASWVLAGNYLTSIPGHENLGTAQEAFLRLAREVGRRKILAWLPATDPIKEEIGRELTGDNRRIFRRLAPPAGAIDLDDPFREEMARDLAGVAPGVEAVDPTPFLFRVPMPVFVAHSRSDRLVPWTEARRLERALPDGRVRHTLITGLFGHSFVERRIPTPGTAVEAVRFVRGISRLLRLP